MTDAEKSATAVAEESEEEVESLAARKANGASLLIIVSRITGFGRTMAQANALSGALMAVASCYTVASTLPNFLYELVMGGMLITSFLPVYLSVRRRLGSGGAADYASNLLSLVLLAMGALSVLCLVSPCRSCGRSLRARARTSTSTSRSGSSASSPSRSLLYGASSVISGVLTPSGTTSGATPRPS